MIEQFCVCQVRHPHNVNISNPFQKKFPVFSKTIAANKIAINSYYSTHRGYIGHKIMEYATMKNILLVFLYYLNLGRICLELAPHLQFNQHRLRL